MKPSLLTIARRSLATEARLPAGSALLVAVSGGPDSIALVHVLARLAPRCGLALHAHGVDHGLRPEAGAELDVAAEVAAGLGVPFGRTRVSVAPGGNLMARARTARYAALAAAARAVGAPAIATAHHADDRAETVLMRLMRGAGPRGLAALPPRAPLHVGDEPTGTELIRPFLRARRTDIAAHVARHRLPTCQDPSNGDPRFLRTRVRREVLPQLEALAPGIVTHLASLADQLAETFDPSPTDLGRATQVALTRLARLRSTTARVWLPGGFVVSLDPRARPGPGTAPET